MHRGFTKAPISTCGAKNVVARQFPTCEKMRNTEIPAYTNFSFRFEDPKIVFSRKLKVQNDNYFYSLNL